MREVFEKRVQFIAFLDLDDGDVHREDDELVVVDVCQIVLHEGQLFCVEPGGVVVFANLLAYVVEYDEVHVAIVERVIWGANEPLDGVVGAVLTHAGSNAQNFAVAWAAPLKDFAVLVATNQDDDNGDTARACDEVAATLIGQFLLDKEGKT